jgi:hypothetical protein
MSTTKTPGAEIGSWLRANGLNLGALTGQDWPALRAAAEILACYARSDSAAEPHLLAAFKGAVMAMQPSTRRFAFHAIAHAMDWHARAVIWQRAGLPPFTEHPGRCAHES